MDDLVAVMCGHCGDQLGYFGLGRQEQSTLRMLCSNCCGPNLIRGEDIGNALANVKEDDDDGTVSKGAVMDAQAL